VERTPHPPFGHLLPQGEEANTANIAVGSSLLPLREKVDRPKAETDEGLPVALDQKPAIGKTYSLSTGISRIISPDLPSKILTLVISPAL
jgi:hypothetical protein